MTGMHISPIEPQARRNLLKLARAYQIAAPQKGGKPNKLSTISKYSRGDPRFFENLEAQEAEFQRTGSRSDNKGSCTLRIYDEVVLWFKEHWPENADFPFLDDLTHNQERTQNGTPERQQEQAERPLSAEAEEAPRPPSKKAGTGSRNLLAKLRRTAG